MRHGRTRIILPELRIDDEALEVLFGPNYFDEFKDEELTEESTDKETDCE